MLASNVPGAVDELLGGIPDASGVMAKETEADTAKLADSVRKAMFDKRYPMCILIPADHIRASIALNRDKNIRAATCLSKEDARLAEENGANVIIIPHGNEAKAAEALGGFFLWAAQQNPEQDAKPAPELPGSQKTEGYQKQQPKQEAGQEPENRGVHEGRGMFRKLKYSLGIDE